MDGWKRSYLLRELAYDLRSGGWREWLQAAAVAALGLALLWVLCAWAAVV